MLSQEERQVQIEKIRNFPAELEVLISQLSEEQLTNPYLDGEWTIAQNVHHVADSHMNSYIRLKLILTEDNPMLKPYDETKWAQFADATPPEFTDTFQLLRGLHSRWATVFASLTEDQWRRTGTHPANGQVLVEEMLTGYVAHGEAHLDQIRRTLRAAEA